MAQNKRHSRGLTLVEAVLLLVIVSIVAVAAGVGLQAVAKVPGETDDTMGMENVMVNVVEQTKATLQKSWPSGNPVTFSSSLLVNGVSYGPTTITVNTTATSSPTTVTTTLSINNRPYAMSLAVDKADPAGGTSYQADFLQVTARVTPMIGGSQSTTLTQKVVTYVTQP